MKLEQRASGPRERRARWLVFATAFLLHTAMALVAAIAADVPFSNLAVFFDGHLYLEIAKSFPLPYSSAGPHYAGHAPGYPAAIYLLKLIVPDAAGNWGLSALVAVFGISAFASVVFYDVCRAMKIPALGGAALFTVANPQWFSLASTAHAEPLAVLFVLLSLRAYLEDDLPFCVLFLSLATLTRFPALLLGIPFAWGTLVARGRRDAKAVLLLGTPILALGLLHTYLSFRIPGFQGIWEAHAVFWAPDFIAPFAGLVAWAKPWLWRWFTFALTYGTAAVYLLSIVLGLLPGIGRAVELGDSASARQRGIAWMLAIWVASILFFHVSLANSAPHLPRLAILAWPAALLIFGRVAGARVSRRLLVAICVCAALFSGWISQRMAVAAVELQRDRGYIEEEISLLADDAPSWIDFERGERAASSAPSSAPLSAPLPAPSTARPLRKRANGQ